MRRLAAALLPALVFALSDLVVTVWSGRPEALGSPLYHLLLPAAALGRFAGMFVLAGAAWWLLRRAGSARGWRVLGVISGPLAYSLSAMWHVLSYFPTGQAAYYGLNPLVVAAVGSSIATAAVAEMLWRRRPAIGLLGLAALGWAVLWATVLWDGGVHWFYVYQQGFKALFG